MVNQMHQETKPLAPLTEPSPEDTLRSAETVLKAFEDEARLRLGFLEVDAQYFRQTGMSLPAERPLYGPHSFHWLAVENHGQGTIYTEFSSTNGVNRYEKPLRREEALKLVQAALAWTAACGDAGCSLVIHEHDWKTRGRTRV